MNKLSIATFTIISMAVVGISGCGATTSTNSSTPASAPATSNTSTSQAQSSTQQAGQVVQLSIKTDVKGSDGKQHVAFVPADFTLKQGAPVKFEISNYDTEMHTLTSTSLNLNVTINAATTAGKPVVTDATFTPQQAGTFSWMCMNPCDTANGEWSMSQKGFMQGTITVK